MILTLCEKKYLLSSNFSVNEFSSDLDVAVFLTHWSGQTYSTAALSY